MIPHNPTQQHPSAHNRHRLADISRRLFAQQSAPSACHWVCIGCGTAHTRMLPEECINCGATALEFEYIPGRPEKSSHKI